MSSKLCQVFSVKRQLPELIVPAGPTPREAKQLSDIDAQEGLRFQVPVIFFYKNDPSMRGKDPVKVIREALGKALVFYYPLAGRLREGLNRKLTVDCTGEGVLFIEADADFTLEQLGDEIEPPCPYLDELLWNVPGSDGILGCPLLLIQVTRLRCGGFIFAVRLNHTMCDAPGLIQFLETIKEMICGEDKPSLFPVWQRKILNARSPPRVTCFHHEYDTLAKPNDMDVDPTVPMDHKSFYFGPEEIRVLRNHLPPHLLNNCSIFDLVTACLWRCRTAALCFDSDEIVHVSCLINVRGKHYNMHIPKGYYGNAFAFPAACSKAEILCRNPLGYSVELVKQAKAQMNEEYIRSVADLMEITGRRTKYVTRGNFIVSDTTRSGMAELDLGWGNPLYGGPAGGISLISFYMKYRKSEGENGIVVPICLPLSAMDRFQGEIKKMIQGPPTEMLCKL
ncbi:hypothetical protein LWI29_037286 [Acer saccharum]|uniref:Methanol O-anthraniloyltransferase n=1 Tax=Acer saccharum TaxID=4024 RepID=A0AA39TC41_ACESA|nr:hypothetical protein LWI29_028121 [Acer saccharum]KAK0606396.1 hypothetical protein LWI29_037286 [Acer saccharum]KAK1587589.1 hypothetical protein Q3G72_014482 [Acer saccharum]